VPARPGAHRGNCSGMSATRPLWQLTATELAAGFAAREFTPVDALQSIETRCAAVNDKLNAVITFNPKADSAARESAKRWRDGTPYSALDGVPMTIKDNLLVAGMRATWGSRAFAEFVPDEDELPVARLRKAGLVFFGKTNVPELTLQGYTDNLMFGPTANPWCLPLTPGGSSGGAVAAIAGGIGPLALCTDGGGSIRRPAAHTGLFGFKPSSGMVARGNGFPAILGGFEVVGPIARSLEDISLLLDLLAPDPVIDQVPANPRILYARSFAGQPVDPEVLRLVDRAADGFADAGCRVTSCDSLDIFAPLDAVWSIVSTAGVAHLFEAMPQLAELAGTDIRAMAAAGQARSGSDYAGAMARIEELRLAFDMALEGHDFLLTPAIAALSWDKTKSHPSTISGKSVGPRGHAIFTAFANALGLPAISIPTGRSSIGLPVGLQLVARHRKDRQLLATARLFTSDRAAELPEL